jgi:hypothetical protein
MVSILSQINAVRSTPSCLSKIHLNTRTINTPMTDLPGGLFPSGFPTNKLHCIHIFPIPGTCPAYFIPLDLTIPIILWPFVNCKGYLIDRLCGLVVKAPGYGFGCPWFESRRYQMFWEVVGLERGPLSLVSKIEALLERNSSESGLENRKYDRGIPFRWPLTLFPQKLDLTSPTSTGRSVGIVRSRTKATEFIV